MHRHTGRNNKTEISFYTRAFSLYCSLSLTLSLSSAAAAVARGGGGGDGACVIHGTGTWLTWLVTLRVVICACVHCTHDPRKSYISLAYTFLCVSWTELLSFSRSLVIFCHIIFANNFGAPPTQCFSMNSNSIESTTHTSNTHAFTLYPTAKHCVHCIGPENNEHSQFFKCNVFHVLKRRNLHSIFCFNSAFFFCCCCLFMIATNKKN